jgi:tRNA(Arg) A34 adenosine deaminase TadA
MVVLKLCISKYLMLNLPTRYVMPSRHLAAEKYVNIAVRQAERARDAGTFGVGGLLVGNDDGAIYKTIRNQVIKNGSVHDPTAHVERQLVDWYFSNKDLLPPTNKMTILTSLDPCVMCSGSILTAGLNSIHVSQDSQAGISCRGLGDFSTLPINLGRKAGKTFSAFGLAGKRQFSGPRSSIFFGGTVDSKFDKRSARAFSSSLKKVKRIINNNHGILPNELIDPKTLVAKPSSRILRVLKKYNPRVFSQEYIVNFEKPGISLGYILIQKAKESHEMSGIFNSACLVDPFGNVLIAESSLENASPIRTPFLELVRKYHKLLLAVGSEGSKYFAHIKYCKTVLLLGPGKNSKSLMEAGCFGASIEGELPKDRRTRQLEYVISQQEPNNLREMLDNLPPLYSDTTRIQDAVCKVKDTKLYEFCKSKTPKYLLQKSRGN